MSLLMMQLGFRKTMHLNSLNLIFVKDLHVVGEIKAKNGCKMTIYESS